MQAIKLTNTKMKKKNTYKNYQLQYWTIKIKLILKINETVFNNYWESWFSMKTKFLNMSNIVDSPQYHYGIQFCFVLLYYIRSPLDFFQHSLKFILRSLEHYFSSLYERSDYQVGLIDTTNILYKYNNNWLKLLSSKKCIAH